MGIFLIAPLLILVALEFKHYVVDFLWQPRYEWENKKYYMHPAGQVHALKQAIGTAIVFFFGSAVFEDHLNHAVYIVEAAFVIDWVLHYHIDYLKEKFIHYYKIGFKNPKYWAAFGFDQFLHHLTYIALVFFLT